MTPSFNQLDWLRLCVASVRDQVADESTDERPATSDLPRPSAFGPRLSSTLRVEHIIQDAGTPGIEDFAREVGADFYREGKLIFASAMSSDERRATSAVSPSTLDSHPSLLQSSPRSSTLDPRPYRLAVHCESDSGMYDAINRGLRRSSGDVCAWLNCDEQYLPGALATASAWLGSHPRIDILCGDIVVTDPDGKYLCSRTALAPQRLHTLISGNLSFLSAATFFRRRLVEAGHYLPDEWKVVGDAAWAERLISKGVRFGTVRKYLAAFADTGENLSVNALATHEKGKLAKQAPVWALRMRGLIINHFRLRKYFSGAYRLKPFSYSVYTHASGSHRMEHTVGHPTQLWPGRIR